MTLSRCVAITGLITLGIAAAAIAQNEANRPRTNPEGALAGYAASPADQMLASWLLVDNQGEIALAEFGRQRAEDKDVKEFAKRIVEDHGRLASKLERFGSLASRDPAADRGAIPRLRPDAAAAAGAAARDRLDADKRPTEGLPRTGQPAGAPAETRVAARPIQPAEGALDVIALKQELGERCVQTAQRELEQKRGEDFDECFMQMQVMIHLAQIDTLEVFSQRASAELQQVISEAKQQAENHLKTARDLAGRFDDADDDRDTAKERRKARRERNRR
ncbi:MAG: DUF4142 domain-containing protein [Planctomycetaceae bacterium]